MFPMMHSRFLLICCIIFSVIWLSSADPDCDCGPYERPVECIDQCQRCEYKNGGCAQPAVCIPGCDCIPGFFRNKQNQCIPAAFCPAPSPTQQCGVYEIPVKCIDQCQTCQYKNGNCTQGAVCIPGCDCIPGFFRNQQKQCIPAHLCPGTGPGPAQQCPAGEIPVGCIDRCQRCEYKNGNCAQIQVCTPGCNCVPGFLRDSTNKCIPANFCPDQCKSDEQFYPDIPDCKNTCEYINNPGTICPQYFAARPGCFCKKGLVKRKDGKCVKPENCGPPGFPCLLEVDAGPCRGYFPRFYFNKKTGQCEEFIYGGCKGNANNFEDKKLCEIVCKGTGPGPAQQCPANEIPVGCIDRCQRCEFKNGNYCAQIQVCTPGCNCVPGFLRDSTNKCIPANFCPDQCKSDEQFYPDIPDCKNTCENYNNPGAICPQYFAARPGCFCKKGLVKRKDGKCVKPEDCGPPPGFPCSLEVDAGPCYGYFPRFYFNKKTGQCEEFIYGGCEGNANNFEDKKLCEIVCKGPSPTQQCGQYERPVECIDQCQTCEYRNGGCAQPAVCIPGCDCIPGFFRNKQKQCIPAAFCPGTGPGPAQQCPAYEYPVPCIDKCQTCEYKNGHCIQTGECTPGCNCVPGFLRDSTKKCIPASRCP